MAVKIEYTDWYDRNFKRRHRDRLSAVQLLTCLVSSVWLAKIKSKTISQKF